jgi:hypothetical protein
MTSAVIVACMCYAGNVEHMGTFRIDSEYQNRDLTLIDLFVPEDRRLICDGNVLCDRDYLYSYNDRLRNERGEVGADAVLEIITKNGVIKDRVYLYEIE